MTVALLMVGMVGVVTIWVMDDDPMSAVPRSRQGKAWLKNAPLMAAVGFLGVLNFWDELEPAGPLRKVLILSVSLFFLVGLAENIRVFCRPHACGFRRDVVLSRGDGDPVDLSDWRHWQTGLDRSARSSSVIFLWFWLWLAIVLVPEVSLARQSLAQAFLWLSVSFFALPPLLATWPRLVGLESGRVADMSVVCWFVANLSLVGTLIAWPEAVSADACLQPENMLLFCGVLTLILLLGYWDVRRQFGPHREDRKNGAQAFWTSLFVLFGTTVVLAQDMKNSHLYCAKFQQGDQLAGPAAAANPISASHKVSSGKLPADASSRASSGGASGPRARQAVLAQTSPSVQAGQSSGGQRQHVAGGVSSASGAVSASPAKVSDVDALRALLSDIHTDMSITFLEEPSRGAYRLGLNYWRVGGLDSAYVVERAAATLLEAGKLLTLSQLRFVSVEMRLMGLVQDRYGVRHPKPLMRFRLDEKTMQKIQWDVIDEADLLNLVSVELEAEGLVPMMGYCHADRNARQASVFCRLAGMNGIDREARLRRQLTELCEAVEEEVGGQYDGMGEVEDLCRDDGWVGS